MAAAATAAAQDEGEKEVHLGVVHCAPKCHCKLLIQMTVTLADGSVLEADGDLLLVFSSSSSFFILLVLVAAKLSENVTFATYVSLTVASGNKQKSLDGSILPGVFNERQSKTGPR